VHTYEFRSQTILSASANRTARTGVFEARATVLDVTSGTPVTVDTNALLRITLTDGGTTGPDRIGATLWRDDGALYYSSLWDGSETDEDEIDGGDLLVG
jgi:hypothetical protein